MSGKNRLLTPGELLFRVGENSDGMYLIRSGQILVYLDKAGTEIPLATIGPGSMLGEMALFDKKPRSASARAVDKVEVTKITNDEFNKIMCQIPKWFVTLMSTLSSRLRDTNERLQDVEAKYKGSLNPIEELIKTLQILQLLWFKMGVKEVKSWSIERELAEAEVALILNKERLKVSWIVDAIIQGGLISASKNSYHKDLLTINNRGDLERFIDFSRKIRKKNNALKYLPQEFVDLTEHLSRSAKAGAYDNFSIDFKTLEADGKKKGFLVEKWLETVAMLTDIDDALVITKVANDINIKILKKGIDVILQHAKILRAISRLEEKRASGKAA